MNKNKGVFEEFMYNIGSVKYILSSIITTLFIMLGIALLPADIATVTIGGKNSIELTIGFLYSVLFFSAYLHFMHSIALTITETTMDGKKK